MSPQQRLNAYFSGRREDAARALGISRETFRLWLVNGIPLKRAWLVEQTTEGFVKADDIFKHAKKHP